MSVPDKIIFADPPGEFRPVPFWFWNGDMREDEIDRQLREMKDKGVYEAFIHARKYLEVPYLSETWFDRVGFTLDKAAEYGMRMWLYDEDNWPSGYAGGRVMQADPNCRAKGLERVVVPIEGKSSVSLPEGKLVYVLATDGDGESFDLTGNVRDGKLKWTPPPGSWQINFFMERYGSHKGAYSEEYYTDLIDPNTATNFIRITHDEYYKRFKEHFDKKTIAGIFTDEPGSFINTWGMDDAMSTWTDDFHVQFKAKKGYDLRPHLISIWEDIGDYKRVRADYFDVFSTLFRDRYFKPIMDWCLEQGIKSIGHILVEEELWYNARFVGDFFRSMQHLTIPGIDEITQMREDPDVITAKLGSSASHVFGRDRLMSETFGCYDWRLSLAQMKWVTDWQYARGVNLLIPHAFYYSIEGERKNECPPSEFYQNIWWKYFKLYADYVGRISYLNSLGHHVADVAIYYPITSVWAEITPTDITKPLEIGARFKEVSTLLLANQRDFDYLNDDAIKSATISDGKLLIEGEAYRAFIIPAATVMAVDVTSKLADFCRSGGMLIVYGDLPQQAVISGTDEELAGVFNSLIEDSGSGRFIRVTSAKSTLAALEPIKADVILDPPHTTMNYLHRRMGNTDIYFLANRLPETLVLVANFHCAAIPSFWNAEDGTTTPVAEYSQSYGYTAIPLELPGYGSKYIVFEDVEDRPHVIGTNLPDVIEATEKVVRARVRRAGVYYADVAMGDIVTRRVTTVPSMPPVIDLKTGWSFKREEDSESMPTELGSWTDHGFADYSGSATYSIDFDLSADYLNRPIMLDLGTVRESAEVWVNGKLAGIRIWYPYTVDIGPMAAEGTNRIEVVVTNTLQNRFANEPHPSGLLGPVRIVPLEEIVLE